MLTSQAAGFFCKHANKALDRLTLRRVVFWFVGGKSDGGVGGSAGAQGIPPAGISSIGGGVAIGFGFGPELRLGLLKLGLGLAVALDFLGGLEIGLTSVNSASNARPKLGFVSGSLVVGPLTFLDLGSPSSSSKGSTCSFSIASTSAPRRSSRALPPRPGTESLRFFAFSFSFSGEGFFLSRGTGGGGMRSKGDSVRTDFGVLTLSLGKLGLAVVGTGGGNIAVVEEEIGEGRVIRIDVAGRSGSTSGGAGIEGGGGGGGLAALFNVISILLHAGSKALEPEDFASNDNSHLLSNDSKDLAAFPTTSFGELYVSAFETIKRMSARKSSRDVYIPPSSLASAVPRSIGFLMIVR